LQECVDLRIGRAVERDMEFAGTNRAKAKSHRMATSNAAQEVEKSSSLIVIGTINQ
jgi:hypothetical protein